ncbi:MAG: lytic murein transglycosylase B [Hylemonella sp.]|nr:lytic murein transglycosylase B [Hylemonella sp.]
MNTRYLQSLLIWAAALGLLHGTTAAKSSEQQPRYSSRPEAMALADDIAVRQGLDRQWVRRAIGRSTLQPQVIKLMTPAPASTPKNWAQYRSRVVDPVRIKAGVRFWRAHRKTLARAERRFGVPAEIIVGILGVETLYGRHMGSYRVIDTLATLAFDFPSEHPRAQQRSEFFKKELEYLLSLRRQHGINPLKIEGSYAGAMGMSQFMPSSWAKYAIDFDGDGRVNLFKTADAIGSVANYFRNFKWQPGMPTHFSVDFDPQRLDMDALLEPDIRPTFDVTRMAAKGVMLDDHGQRHSGLLALVELPNGEASPTYVAGTENFYAITRYNWSSQYAMAVIELGRAVASALRNR